MILLASVSSPLGRPGYAGWEKPRNLLKEPRLQEMADKYGKSVAQIILRWMVSQGRRGRRNAAYPEGGGDQEVFPPQIIYLRFPQKHLKKP